MTEPILPARPLVVVMGVAGSGKTSLGVLLGERLGVPFADGDDFHDPANVAKMSAGRPLDDEDRLPWLRTLGHWLAQRAATGGVLCCSALKRSYRDVLREASPTVIFVHADPPRDVVHRRLVARQGHFMPASLIDSQFRALERLALDEGGITLPGDVPVADLVAACLPALLGTP